MYNPFTIYRVTGDWAEHIRNTGRGGKDRGFPYGTPLRAPAAGVLQSRATPGFGELDTGWIGDAGRRSILWFHEPIGELAGIVLQHQSVMGPDGAEYNEGDVVGLSGASGNHSDYGAQTHIHYHGITRDGRRVDFDIYVTNTTPAGGDTTLIIIRKKGKDMDLSWDLNGTGYLTTPFGVLGLGSMQIYTLFQRKIRSDQNLPQPEVFNTLEQQMMDNTLKVLVHSAQTQVQFNVDLFASAVADALGEDWDPKVDVKPEVIAAALEAATPRVINAMLKEQGRRLAGETPVLALAAKADPANLTQAPRIYGPQLTAAVSE